jgi:DNA replication protein DnaC
MNNSPESNIIKIPFDPACSPREQIEAAVAYLPPRLCERHPDEVLPLDLETTIRRALYLSYPSPYEPKLEFSMKHQRCSECPHTLALTPINVTDCPVGLLIFGETVLCDAKDEAGKPVPCRRFNLSLNLSRSPNDILNALQAQERICRVSGELLEILSSEIKPPFNVWVIEPQYRICAQLALERLGLAPDEASASFKSFIVEPPEIRPIFETCQTYSKEPHGILLLLGNAGTGKTHLAVSSLRERHYAGASNLCFITHRRFREEYRRSSKPVPFDEKPPESPLVRCQNAEFLVYDDITEAKDNRFDEDVLIELFEYRIGHYKPSIITSNLSREELEAVLGTRLFDRLRRAAYAVLEFGFPSNRPLLNTAYLDRSRTRP